MDNTIKQKYDKAELKKSNWRTVFNFSSLTLMTIFLVTRLENPTPIEFMALPIMLLAGNVGIYFIHKYPLHRYWKWFNYPYQKHTVEHHNYYQYHNIEIHSFGEITNIVFPPEVILSFLLIYIPGVYYLAQLVFSQNVSIFIVLGSTAYFLAYETMHTICHVPHDHFLLKNRFIKFMWNHHRLHHHHRLMNKWNFGIVYPLMDYLMGTLIRDLPENMKAEPDSNDSGVIRSKTT